MVLLILLSEALSLKIPKSKVTWQLNQVSKSKLQVSFPVFSGKYGEVLISKDNKVFKRHYMTNSGNLSDINLFKISKTNPRQKVQNIRVIRLESIHGENIGELQRRDLLRGSR